MNNICLSRYIFALIVHQSEIFFHVKPTNPIVFQTKYSGMHSAYFEFKRYLVNREFNTP